MVTVDPLGTNNNKMYPSHQPSLLLVEPEWSSTNHQLLISPPTISGSGIGSSIPPTTITKGGHPPGAASPPSFPALTQVMEHTTPSPSTTPKIVPIRITNLIIGIITAITNSPSFMSTYSRWCKRRITMPIRKKITMWEF